MAECCDPVPYRRFFNTKEASRRLERYRREGLDPRAADIVRYLGDRVEGMDVLEVGGGVGDVQVELLEAGATRARNVELSDAYESAAATLARERGLGDRMEQRYGDFVGMQADVEPADIVILNRVVCCYPHMERMMGAAVAKARRFLGVVVPRDRWWNRTAVRVGNAYTSLRRCSFDAFVHPTEEIDALAVADGLSPVHRGNDFIWVSTVYERVA